MQAGLFGIADVNEFVQKYYARLYTLGVDMIDSQLKYYESLGMAKVTVARVYNDR